MRRWKVTVAVGDRISTTIHYTRFAAQRAARRATRVPHVRMVGDPPRIVEVDRA